MKKYICFCLLSSSLFLLDACAVNPVSGKRQVVLMSEAQELAMGKEADPQIIAQYGLYEDKDLQNFVTQKGKEMGAVSHRNNINYEFRILDSEVLNAFAIPGGYVYVTRGIMGTFNNEAEFAGVLGHEIGHIAARHSVAQQRNALLGQLGIIAGIVIVPDLARFAETASQGLGLLFLKFGRDAEREADKLGVEYSSKVRYDAQQMANFFKTLERQSSKTGEPGLPDFLSTHPSPGDRFVTVGKLATEWKQTLNLTNPLINRNTYLKRIEGIIYGEDPKQGYVENSSFYHPELKLQFTIPRDWAYQNSPQQFQMAPKNGKAMMMLTMAPGKTLQEASSVILQQNSLKALESRNITVNGLNAIYMVAEQAQEQGTIRTLSYIIQYGNNIYHMIGLSASTDFNTYVPFFTSTMQSFRQLTDASRLNRKPERIHIKTVTQDATLEQTLRTFGIPAKRLEELSILNGMKLNDRITKGTLIKVVGQ